jgi:hypothetical protein
MIPPYVSRREVISNVSTLVAIVGTLVGTARLMQERPLVRVVRSLHSQLQETQEKIRYCDSYGKIRGHSEGYRELEQREERLAYEMRSITNNPLYEEELKEEGIDRNILAGVVGAWIISALSAKKKNTA